MKQKNNKEKLKLFNKKDNLIFNDDNRIESFKEDTMLSATPDAVLRARDEKDIKEALIFCNNNKIPLTFCATQTSMTGSSVTDQGLLVSIQNIQGIIDIETKSKVPFVRVKPGTIVADLQNRVNENDLFYPVAPTSRDECTIGGNVITNATGEDSFKYGAARKYVKSIRIILANGSEKTLQRDPYEMGSEEANKAGYFTSWKNPIDLFIGSEGTLGYVAEIELYLLKKSNEFFSALIPFDSNTKGLEFIVDSVKNKTASLRTLEFIDHGALKAMKTAQGFNDFPNQTQSLVYFKQEFDSENDKMEKMEKLYNLTHKYTSNELADSILIADTPKQKENFRLWRHRIPEWANEQGRIYWKNKGAKIGSDWWVPVKNLLKMMDFFYKQAENIGLPYMAYAHLGRGHPHTNLIAKNDQERLLAKEMLIRCCKKAVSLGGGVTGEHGIGKIHTDLMKIQHSNDVIEKMKSWKREYDPNWIIGKGNLFK